MSISKRVQHTGARVSVAAVQDRIDAILAAAAPGATPHERSQHTQRFYTDAEYADVKVHVEAGIDESGETINADVATLAIGAAKAWAARVVRESAGWLEKRQRKGRRVSRRVEPVQPNEIRHIRASGPWYHGTRAIEMIGLDGVCVPPAGEMIHPPDTGFPADAVRDGVWSHDFEYPPPMSVVARLESEYGWESEYDWVGIWRHYTYDWFTRDLGDAERENLVAQLRTGGFRDADLLTSVADDADAVADALGSCLSLFWITRDRALAEDYGTPLEIDTRKANTFGSYVDDIVARRDSYVLVLPTWCPQIPVGAITELPRGRARANRRARVSWAPTFTPPGGGRRANVGVSAYDDSPPVDLIEKRLKADRFEGVWHYIIVEHTGLRPPFRPYAVRQVGLFENDELVAVLHRRRDGRVQVGRVPRKWHAATGDEDLR